MSDDVRIDHAHRARQRRAPAPALVGLCLAYAAGMVAFFTLRDLPGHTLAPAALVETFWPFLFLPAPLVLAGGLLLRSRPAVAASLGLILLFAGTYGSAFLPRFHAVEAADSPVITVMTFNIRHDNPHPGRPGESIARQDADVVVVEELTDDAATRLRARLGDRFPYMILEPEAPEPHASGVGLLTRYPIISSEWFILGADGKTGLHAVLDVNGRPVDVVAVHPPPPGLSWFEGRLPIGISVNEREQQMVELIGRLHALEGPVILLGDFNMSDQTRAYRRLAAILGDSYHEAGPGLGLSFPQGARFHGLPLPGPFVRIDYIFHSAGLVARSAQTVCDGASDHCFVVARLALGAGGK